MLSGRISRGVADRINAVIWYSDLRGYTTITDMASPDEIIPLDLHSRVFGVDRCAQSHLAKAPILIRQVDEVPSFEIVVRRSFADYLWTWLEDAASEYPLAIEASTSTPAMLEAELR